jgi:hypothetical protein
MLHDNRLTTTAIQAAFVEEITAIGGTVADIFDDGERLFVRSVLPRAREVLPKDRVQDGVALRATGGDVWIHPYVFRQVCSNGAIVAHAVQTRRIDGIDFLDPEQAESAIREALQACCAEECFTAFAQEMRSASEVQADLALNLMPLLSRLTDRNAARFVRDIMFRFAKDADQSRFGLMNAVTSVARDTSDPEMRWRLEELGGGIAAGRLPTPASDGGRAKRPARVLQSIA